MPPPAAIPPPDDLIFCSAAHGPAKISAPVIEPSNVALTEPEPFLSDLLLTAINRLFSWRVIDRAVVDAAPTRSHAAARCRNRLACGILLLRTAVRGRWRGA